MFWQMVKGALLRQKGRFILIALTVALGVSLATAMLDVAFDVGSKVNKELKARRKHHSYSAGAEGTEGRIRRGQRGRAQGIFA